jgi:predicted RNase H-like HicB family nuclease
MSSRRKIVKNTTTARARRTSRPAVLPTRFYAAFIHKEPRSSFSVVFPDLPGCTSAGDTLEHALLNAQDALQGHIDVSAEYGDAIPEATPLARVKPSAADKKHLVMIQLVAVVMPGRAVKVMISLDGGLLSRIDSAAGRYGRSRFIADAAKEKLTARG